MNYVSKKAGIAFALFMAAEAIFNTLIGNFVQVFFTDMGVTAAAVGTIFVVARIWDAVNDPMFGVIVDKSHLKGGKFLPWLKMANVLVPLTAVLIFLMPSSLGSRQKVAWAAVTYILYGMAYTISDVSVFSLTSAVTNQVQERTDLVSRNTMISTLAIVMISILVPVLYPRIGWKATAILFTVLAAAMMLLLHGNVKERFVEGNKEQISLKETMLYLKNNRYLFLFFAGLLVLNCTNTVNTAGLYFCTYALGMPQFMSLISLAVAIPTVIFSVLMPRITQRFDKFLVFRTAVIGQIAVAVLTFLLGYQNLIVLLIMFLLRGCVYGCMTILMFLFAGDFVEYGEYRFGRRLQGTAYSIQTFVCKLYTAINGAITMFGLSMAGFISGSDTVQTPAAIQSTWWMVSIVPAIGAALSLIFFFRYKLRDKDVQIMARANSGEISRAEAEQQLGGRY